MVEIFLKELDQMTWHFNEFTICLLTRNHFTFLRINYLQMQEVSMGISHAPANANLYLEEIICLFIFSDKTLSLYI